MANSNSIKSTRTTITLEEDVSQAIKDRLKRNPDLREKALINELLRRGLKEPVSSNKKFKIKPLKATLRPGVILDNVEALLEDIES
jgi:hypothetical protein